MQSANTTSLIAAAPINDLLLLAALFTLFALIVFALAVEAGNYPNFSIWMRRTRTSLHNLRHRHWHGEGRSTLAPVTGR